MSDTIVFDVLTNGDQFGELRGYFAPATTYLNRPAAPYLLGMTQPMTTSNAFQNAGVLNGVFAPATFYARPLYAGVLLGQFEPAIANLAQNIPAPQFATLRGFMRPATAAMVGTIENTGSLHGVFAPANAYLRPFDPPYLAGQTVPMLAAMVEELHYVGGFGIAQSPGVMHMATAGSRTYLPTFIGLRASASGNLILGLDSAVALGDEPTTALSALTALASSTALGDGLDVVYRVLVAAGFELDDASAASMAYANELTDALRLLGGAGSALGAMSVVASAVAMQDMIARIARETLTDQVTFNDLMLSALTARQQQLDSVLLRGETVPSAIFSALVADQVAIGDSVGSLLEALARATDSLGLSLTIRLGDSVYVAWVCNTRTKAFSQYENYPFNSFARFGGRYYGMADDGIYELTGNDDAGTPIAARIRMGLNNLGTGKLKRMPSMYLGYSSSGRLLLKVITTSPGGEKEENWYALAPQHAGVPREGRIKIGRGLKSVYYDFEIASIAGSEFDLDQIQLFPMILDRRITGESNG